MPVDHVRFCADKYLQSSYGFRTAEVRSDLVGHANPLIETLQPEAGAVLGVQMTAEDSDEIAFVVSENGLFLVDVARFVPYASIVHPHSDYDDKQNFRAIDLELEDGSTVRLKVESGPGMTETIRTDSIPH